MHISVTPRAGIYAYVNRIQNERKRQYAERYAAWRLRGQPGEPPGDTGISPMAAQAVRMNIDLLSGQQNIERAETLLDAAIERLEAQMRQEGEE